MPVKLIMTWDISPQKEQEYFEFVVREFIPGVQRLGLELSDAWATVYGSGPQIMVSGIFPNLEKAQQVVLKQEWQTLTNQLLDFVQNYSFKLVDSKTSFQF